MNPGLLALLKAKLSGRPEDEMLDEPSMPMPAPRRRLGLGDLLLGAAAGYAKGASSEVPEEGLASGFLSGSNAVQEAVKRRAEMENLIDVEVSPGVKRKLTPEQFITLSKSLKGKRTFMGIQGMDALFYDDSTDQIVRQPIGEGKVIKPGAEKPAEQPKKDKPPTGFRFTGAGDLEAIPGGPADIKGQAADEKSTGMREASIRQADLVINKINQALPMVNNKSAGFGAITKGIPTTPAKNLETVLNTIKANLAFEKLQEMRRNSPTGGALGQVAVRELELLETAVASLEQSQDPEQLKRALVEVSQHFQDWKSAMSQSSTPASERIRVRRKDTNQTGSIPAERFDPAIHERL